MIGSRSWRHRAALSWAAVAGAVLAAAIALGWRAGEPSDAASAAAMPTIWQPPASVAENPERDAAILRARRPWGGSGSFRDTDAVPVAVVAQPWTLVGTVQRGEQRYALIRVGPPSAKIEYRGIGQKLPDGSIVDKIDADGIATAGGSGHGGPTPYRLFDRKTERQ